MFGVNSIDTSEKYLSYSSISSDIDLLTVEGGAGRPCRFIYCGGAGDLVVTKNDGNDETIPVSAGYVHLGSAKAVKSTSTVTNVTIYW